MENQLQTHTLEPENAKKISSPGSGPETDWKIIFLATVALILLVTAINVFLFFRLSGEPVAEENNGEGLQTLNIEALKKAAAYYENKAAEFEKILNGTSVPADPSI